jgi:Na+/phosphate symporter
VHLGIWLAVYRDRCRTINELKTAITAYLINISQADLQKVFANKIERVQACIDARGHHFQHILLVHSDFPNAL